MPTQPFLHFEGVPFPLQPGAALLGKTMEQIGRYVQDPANGVVHVDNSVYINRVAADLNVTRGKGYQLLIDHPKNRALIGKKMQGRTLDEEALKNLFETMYKSMWQNHAFWAELVDVSPEKRGVALPEGKDIVLYRGARFVDDGIDVAGAEKIFLSMPEEETRITPEWATALGADPRTYYNAVNADYPIKHLNGLTSLVWDLRDREWPYMDSFRRLDGRDSGRGALLGRAQNRVEVYRARLQREIEGAEDPLAETEAIIAAAQSIRAGMARA